MPRTDVYRKDGKFYLVPVYVADFLKPTLPLKAIVAATPEKDWPAMEEKDFLFSLFKNDLVSINRTGKPEDEIRGYYVGCHSGTGNITIEIHDRSNITGEGKTRKNPWEGKGVKTVKSFRKFQVDVLGHYEEVKREKRLGTRKNRCPGA
jgi:CRISPR-associated endonuclease Csn1